MASNRTRRTSFGAPATTGAQLGGPVYNSNERLEYRDSNQDVRYIKGSKVVKKDASFTVTPEDDGKTFIFDSPTSVVATLPEASEANAGLEFTFIVEQLTTATGHSLSPAAADFITGNGLTATVDKDLICTHSSDRVGDAVTVVNDGELGYYIKSIIGTWAKES